TSSAATIGPARGLGRWAAWRGRLDRRAPVLARVGLREHISRSMTYWPFHFVLGDAPHLDQVIDDRLSSALGQIPVVPGIARWSSPGVGKTGGLAAADSAGGIGRCGPMDRQSESARFFPRELGGDRSGRRGYLEARDR